MTAITIRTIHTIDEMQAAVELQKIHWGQDIDSLVPVHMLLSIARYGGHVHAAFSGERMVGLLIGFIGADIHADDKRDARQRLFIMSKRMVVLPDFRGQKIGELLKLAQRDYAIQHGIELVTWTFDPVLSRNAYLNLHKLGTVGQEYEAEFFGIDVANPAFQGDRLSVNWWVNHPVTVERLTTKSDDYWQSAPMPINKTVVNEASFLVPITELPEASYESLLVEIPLDFAAIAHADPTLAQDWRTHIRHVFQTLLASGYIATDFVRQTVRPAVPESPFADDRERGYYVFIRDDGTFKFSTPD